MSYANQTDTVGEASNVSPVAAPPRRVSSRVKKGTTKQNESIPTPAQERAAPRRANRNVRVEDPATILQREKEKAAAQRQRDEDRLASLKVQQQKLEQKLHGAIGLGQSRDNGTGVPSKMFNGKRYELIESGRNAGKYVQKSYDKIYNNGQHWNQWTILQEPKLDIRGWGSEEGTSIFVGDIECFQVKDGEHKGKYVQKIGPQSLCEIDGRQFLQWIIRQRIPQDDLGLKI